MNVWLIMALLAITGCAGPTLAPAPNLYVESKENPFAAVPPVSQTPDIEVFYATDRVADRTDDSGSVAYGTGRSRVLHLGTCKVTVGKDLTWDQLVEDSREAKFKFPAPLGVIDVHQIADFAETGNPPIEENGQTVIDPADAEANRLATMAIHDEIAARLSASPQKEVFLYVHGYNNTFDDGVLRVAQLWHYLGRPGVPIAYSWPAGSGGLLRGYTHDRESGEFTIFHLKQFILAVASCPEVQKIHLIAHSRGTDVLVTAVRELHMQLHDTPAETRKRLKLGNMVLAAPDIDMEVAVQRMAAEGVGLIPERTTLYLNANDKAIGISSWLFESLRRIGQASIKDLTPAQRAGYARLGGRVGFVDVQVKTDFLGHGYFIENPSVLSDIILLLRDGRAAGSENGRPLIDLGSGFWQLYEGYPGPPPKKLLP